MSFKLLFPTSRPAILAEECLGVMPALIRMLIPHLVTGIGVYAASKWINRLITIACKSISAIPGNQPATVHVGESVKPE